MLSGLTFLTIEIGINPEIREFGPLTLTWHGVFTALGIAAGVYLAVIVGQRLGFLEDDIYTASLIIIPAGIVGARALYVIERWSEFSGDLLAILRINEGGISVYGALLGGLAGAMIYVWIRRLPVRRALDVAAIGAVLGMSIGRIGDLINGEHFSELSGLPWAVRYTHLNNPSVFGHPLDECVLGSVGQKLCSQHPTVGYELLGGLLIFGLLLLILRFARRDGVTAFSFLFLYALMRFGASELRLDSREIFAGLTTPQVTALFFIPIAVVGLVYSWRKGPSEPQPASAEAEPASGSPGP